MILAALKGRMARLFGFSVISQAMLSLTGLVAGVALLRYTSTEDYGYYALALSLVLLPMTLVGSWVSGPMAVLAPRHTPDHAYAMIHALDVDLRRWAMRGLPVGLGACLAAWLGGWLDPTELMVALCTVLAMAVVVRHTFLHGVLYLLARTRAVLNTDGIYVLCLIGFVLLACSQWLPPAPTAVFGIAIAYFLAALVSSRAIYGDLRGEPAADPAVWARIRPLAIWSTLGAAVYWISNQGYNSLLAAMLDIEAVAAVNATRLLLMPVYVLTMGVRSLLVPMSARWLNDHGRRFLLKRLGLIGLLLLAADVIYLAALWVLHDWIIVEVLRTEIPERGALLLLWAVLALLYLPGEIYLAAVVAMGGFRELAWLSMVSAGAVMLVMIVAIPRLGMVGALWGLIAGAIITLAGVVGLLMWRRFPQSPGSV